MKILFGYRYGVFGGVCTQLMQRMRYLSQVPGLETHFVFAQPFGAEQVLSSYGKVHAAKTSQDVSELLEQGQYDATIFIDTPEFLQGAGRASVLINEVHTTYAKSLKYLEELTVQPAAFVVPSEYSRGLVQDYPCTQNREIFCMPNIVDGEMFHPQAGVEAGARHILAWVGKLDQHKNWPAFLRVCRAVLDRRTDVEFWLVGGHGAPEAVVQDLLEVSDSMGLARHFKWLPKLRYEQMPGLYTRVAASGGCVVSTTENESFGMGIAEALLCECPVIAPSVGALPELAKVSASLAIYSAGDLHGASDLVLATLGTVRQAALRRQLRAEHDALAEAWSPAALGPRYMDFLETTIREAASGA
jgi:glycosyltransferase involved in cell wall biosynthesis